MMCSSPAATTSWLVAKVPAAGELDDILFRTSGFQISVLVREADNAVGIAHEEVFGIGPQRVKRNAKRKVEAGGENRGLLRLAVRRLSLSVTPSAEAWLAHAGYDPDFGARPLRRVIQKEVEDRLALDLLAGRYPEGSTITVDVDGDGLVCR